jgi:alkylation response protein AidB-like acyl-CoA dehydrogenase
VVFELTDTQKDIQKAAREFAEKEFDLDLALELEKEGRFPKSIFEKACQLGFVGINYPEQYGGQSFGIFENVLVTEEFCRKDSGIGISISLADIASGIILRYGDERQKKSFLMPVTRGNTINTVAMLDSFNRESQSPIPTKAQEDQSGCVVDGKKVFVVNGAIADYIVLFCESHPGHAAITLLVEGSREGVSILGRRKVMGMRMLSITDISFDHVRVPSSHIIVGGSNGAEHLTAYLIEQRIKTSAQALGIAHRAFDLALKHAKEREQFGRKICQFQGIQFMMSELYTLIEATRSLVYRVAHQYDTNDPDIEKISSVARLFATDVAVRATIDSIQIHGGVGLMKEYPIERMLRDAKTIQNLGETNLVQRALIARNIIS